ncbi:TetR/AcrR family transcriptional regulator [Rhodococcus aetherivorans]|uniref:TetR/AcrR family transcriptional regulator n=1 Tax=Rhodococcus aetherivorans TaxID=191292 RepID=A0AA46NZC6_9NOCA|nr:TetR/AcrR family transcriptional regulator [Rhodococcus aetherivorans]UYF92788.1 TetR/AcrR family transcriptional regulator [Rhodococcus aetherivorans]
MLNRLPADQRRAQLVESALALAEGGGLGAVTVRAVAEHAGVSLGVVHYCFESKEALVAAMGETLVLQLSQALRTAFTLPQNGPDPQGPRGLRQLLYAGITAMWPTIEATADRQLLTYEITTYSLRHRAAGELLGGNIATEQYRIMDVEAQAFLEECAARTGTEWVEPVSTVARLALAMLDGLVLRWLVDRDSDAIVTELDDIAAIVAGRAVETT